ncbi:peptidoglycan editing factor PgeF [Candidatus Microgenomates bacterium]|nr:peptidoglycan editing factor PgeF [Candidatus Microgenomates bacterium]
MPFRFKNLSKLPWLGHAVSTKEFGNLSYFVGDKKANVDANRKKFFSSLGIQEKDVVDAVQVHGNHVVLITQEEQGHNILDTDALITDEKNIPLIIKVADCVPILLADPVKKVVGVVHAGWKGTTQEITKLAVNHMEDHFGTSPSDLIVGIGPSIGPCCYEVDAPVIDAFSGFTYRSKIFSVLPRTVENRKHLDLWLANKFQLIEAGVREKNIEVAGICTYDNSDKFFSERHDKKAGRFGAIIWIK